MTLLASFGERLAAARRAKGLEQNQLAEAIGVHPKTVSRWENNKQPAELEHLERMAQVLEVDRDWLRSGQGEAYQVVHTRGLLREAVAAYTPASLSRLPAAAGAVVHSYLEQMRAAGADQEQVDEAKRLLVEGAFNKINKRDQRERSEEDLITDIDAAWDFIRSVLRKEGKRL